LADQQFREFIYNAEPFDCRVQRWCGGINHLGQPAIAVSATNGVSLVVTITPT
jgi:hypothetical protein